MEEIMPKPETAVVPVPEGDIDRLAGEIQKHKESPEMAAASGEELVRQAIRSMAVPAPAPQAQGSDDSVLPGYAASAPAVTKDEIENLLGVAMRDGISKATSQAMQSNPFVLDAFHDALAGKLYPELQKRKLVD